MNYVFRNGHIHSARLSLPTTTKQAIHKFNRTRIATAGMIIKIFLARPIYCLTLKRVNTVTFTFIVVFISGELNAVS